MDREALRAEVTTVAPALLGALVVTGEVVVRITEVEAYAGAEDPGSHARRGLTPRCAPMFGDAGRAYVYFTYGMHHCLNVVSGPGGTASAVLIRAGEVLEGEAVARVRRDAGRATPQAFRDLARGPARLTRALGVDLDHNGLDLCDAGAALTLRVGTTVPGSLVSRGPRVGVRGPGGDGAAFPWRFWVAGATTVSPYRAAAPRSAVPRNPRR